MSGEKELKPCPLCGGKLWMKEFDRHSQYAGRCDCGFHGPIKPSKLEAVAACNRRATPPGVEMVPEGTIDAICRLVSQYQVGMDCGEQGHLDGIEELIEFVAHRAAQKGEEAEAPDYKALYHELLYQVGIKHPGETRHQTALRYLKNAENSQDNAPHQAKETHNAQG